MLRLTARFRRDEAGTTAVEYGLIGAVLSAVLVVAVTTLSGGLADAFARIAGNFGGT